MDFVRGIHYNKAIQKYSNIEERIQKCISLSAQVALALSSMHQAGLVHLDLKPDNIMVSEHKITLLDFGHACALGHGLTSSLGPSNVHTSQHTANSGCFTQCE